MKLNLTEGSLWKTMLRFSLPFLLSYFLQTLYGMADLYVIGQFCNVESTTAVSIGSQVMHMLTLMIVGLAMGSVVVIGQASGADDSKRVSSAIGNTAALFMLSSLALTFILFFLVDPVIKVMSTPSAAVAGTRDYLRICFLGIPFITAYNIISSVFRGLGDSKSPMYFIAVACVSNIALDYLFIGYFGMGPAGAALGTTLSQTISVVISLLFILKEKEIKLCRKDFIPDRLVMGKILKTGIPIALQDGFIQIAFIIVTIFANLRGLEDAAAVGIVEKIIGILFLVPSAMLQTVSAMAAQNMGAGRHDRARKVLSYSCVVTVVWGLFCVGLMHFKSYEIIGMFSNNETSILMGCQYMRSYVWDCVFAGIHFVFSGYFCAYGYSSLSFLHNVISILTARIPLSYFAAKYFLTSLFPMGLASTSGSLLSSLICIAAYMILKKKKAFENIK